MRVMVATSVVCLSMAGAAGAAEGGSETEGPRQSQIEEIIVTALRREQRLVDVPAAVAVMSGEEIKAKDAPDMRDYLTTVPGVTYAENNVGGSRVTIRGIADGLVGSTEPLAGIYIDEAPVTEGTAATLDPDIYDVERVEILKGPQGTLYGSGSMGGTVRIITKKPILDAFEGVAEGMFTSTADGDYGERVNGVINVPIVSDRLALRLSAGYRDDGGWIDDIAHGVRDANTVEKRNAHGQLLFAPAPDTSIILGFLYQKDERGLPPFADITLPGYQSQRVYRQSAESDAKLFSLTVNQEFEGSTLTSATNYLEKDSVNLLAINFNPNLFRILTGVTLTPADGLGLSAPLESKVFTQEVRLASTGRNRLDWLAGVFYSDVSGAVTEQFDLSQAPSAAGVVTSEEFFTSTTRSDARQVATFGELTVNVTDRFSVTAGARVFNFRKQELSSANGLLNDGETRDARSADLSSSTKKLSLQYEATPDHLLYAQAAQGYRNGGANSEIPSSCNDALAAVGYTSAPEQYGPDDLWNYELGTKNAFFDGRVQLNAAAFYIDWSNIQNTIGLPDCGQTFVDNAGSAETTGVELEAALRPVEGLSVNLSVSSIDAKLTKTAAGAPGQKDDSLPFAPELSWNVGAFYEHELRNGLTGFVRSEVNYVGERWTDFRSVPRAIQLEDYTTISARIGVQTERWSVALFGTNLTDERIVLNVISTNANVSRPRTLGVNFRIGF